MQVFAVSLSQSIDADPNFKATRATGYLVKKTESF